MNLYQLTEESMNNGDSDCLFVDNSEGKSKKLEESRSETIHNYNLGIVIKYEHFSNKKRKCMTQGMAVVISDQ